MNDLPTSVKLTQVYAEKMGECEDGGVEVVLKLHDPDCEVALDLGFCRLPRIPEPARRGA